MKLKETKKTATVVKTKTKTKGFILWQGVSPVDGSPIVAIATLHSENEKTGDMIQTWIMRTDIEPHKAIKNGSDISICGYCPVASGKGCYVLVHNAPLQIYRSYKQGKYPVATPDQLSVIGQDRAVRIGAYGDPAMVPTYIWSKLVSRSTLYTGYTHQYKQPWFDSELLRYCMASANNVTDAIVLSAKKIRYFLALDDNDNLPKNSIACPNYSHGVQCIDCGLCNGGNVGKSIVAPIHGAKSKTAKLQFNIGR